MTRCKSFNMVVHLWVWKRERERGRKERRTEREKLSEDACILCEYIWICIVLADGLAAVSGGAHHDLTMRSAYLNEYKFAYHWHIQTSVLVCLSQADKQSICLKSWRDKKNRNSLKCSSLSFSFVSFMGHKLELFEQLGVVGFCAPVAGFLLEVSGEALTKK